MTLRARPLAAPVAVVGGCLLVSLALLGVTATLAYDPWAWLVWGREVGHLSLDTTGGPSWKPLPVVVASAVAPFGTAAPAVWLVLARTLGLLSVVAVFRLAERLAGRVAGVVAALLLFLTPDAGPRYVRLVLEGHSAPVTAGLAAWAAERHLAGRPVTAFLVLTVLGLDRPEAWPFLAVYGLWLARSSPGCWRLVATCGAVTSLLWFGGDWWGSGSPLHGAGAAQVVVDEPDRLGDALTRARKVVVLPVWVAAAVALLDGWRRRALELPGLIVAAAAWVALVIAMAGVLGYAALARFLLPAAALLCACAAAVVVLGLRRLPDRRVQVAAAIGLVLLCVPSVADRAGNVGTQLDEVASRGRADRELAELIDDVGGPTAMRSCGGLSIDTRDVPRPALAWRAGVALGDVVTTPATPTGLMVVRTGGRAERRILAAVSDLAPVGQAGRWSAYAPGCRPRG
ncbi:MAG: hypothetical protein M3Z03_09105 [Actinomycetota bacterium]|nr:hypothetical protein [Actinomycetota bacterium]